jgi:hypothetical protein
MKMVFFWDVAPRKGALFVDRVGGWVNPRAVSEEKEPVSIGNRTTKSHYNEVIS